MRGADWLVGFGERKTALSRANRSATTEVKFHSEINNDFQDFRPRVHSRQPCPSETARETAEKEKREEKQEIVQERGEKRKTRFAGNVRRSGSARS